MNTLPQNPATDSSVPTQAAATSTGKEVEKAPTVAVESVSTTEQGKDLELSHEVSAIGVSIQPTTVVLPKIVQNAGVRSMNPPAPAAILDPVVKLPLSDDQIAKGLHESVASSVRWLAAWCMRRLKQMHFVVKDVGGKLVRT